MNTRVHVRSRHDDGNIDLIAHGIRVKLPGELCIGTQNVAFTLTNWLVHPLPVSYSLRQRKRNRRRLHMDVFGNEENRAQTPQQRRPAQNAPFFFNMWWMSLGMKKTEPRPNSSEACKIASLLVIMGDRFSLACVRDCFTEFQIDELAKKEHRYERDGKENIARLIVIKSGRQFR